MRSRAGVLVVSIAVAAAIGPVWKASETLLCLASRTEIIAGEAYAIECRDDLCVLDLDFSSSKRYLLIVGSLSPGTETHRITLASRPVEVTRFVPATRLEPLHPRVAGTKCAKTFPESWASQETSAKGAIESNAGETRDFFIHVTDGSPDDERQYARISANLVAEGRHLRVYLDSQQQTGELAPDLPNEIVRLFDSEVLPRCRESVGTYRDVDGDGKFAILLSPWLNRLQGGRTSLGGFTREADFRSDLERPFSNRSDVIYLNSFLRCDAHLRNLLVHEFTHAVSFSVRTSNGGLLSGLPGEEDWLNEAIAHVSENLNGSGWTNLDYRVSRFLNAPHEYPLVVDNYYRNGMWRNHGCRGATYLFLRWCVDQFGEGLPSRLIHSPVTGTRSLEWVTGRTFEGLYRRWTISLYQTGRTVERFPQRETTYAQRKTSEGTNASDRDTLAGDDGASSAAIDGCFKSVHLCGALADWGLAGPRAKAWHVDVADEEVDVRGTSSAYFELDSHGYNGARRLSIRGDYGTRLQVSLIRLPDQWPALRAVAAWNAQPSESPGGLPPGAGLLQPLMVRAHHADANSHVEMIACERNYDETKETHCFTGDSLDRAKVNLQRGNSSGNDEVFELHIPRPGMLPEESRPLVLKMVARDTSGRRATAWATIEELPTPVRMTARFEFPAVR